MSIPAADQKICGVVGGGPVGLALHDGGDGGKPHEAVRQVMLWMLWVRLCG